MLGKSVGDDFREGKITLPVLVAYAAGNETDRVFWRRTIEASEQTDADLDHAMRLIDQTEAIRATLDRAAVFADAAKSALSVFAPSAFRDSLMAVADFTVSRVR